MTPLETLIKAREINRELRKVSNINTVEYEVLMFLSSVSQCECHRIADTQGIDRAAASRALVNLEMEGLASRHYSNSDLRQVAGRITAHGRRYLFKLDTHLTQHMRTLCNENQVQKLRLMNAQT